VIKETVISYPTSELEISIRSVFSRRAIEVHGVLMKRGKMSVLIKGKQTIQLNDLEACVQEAMHLGGIANRQSVELVVG
jgi:hypothetical protein